MKKLTVDIEPSRAWHLLQLSLRTGRPTDIPQFEHGAEHLSERRLRRVPSQAGMGPEAEVDISV